MNGKSSCMVLYWSGNYRIVLLQWHTQDFFSGGVQQIQLRTAGRENRDVGASAP
jgi:hypothetical protein